MVSRSRTVTARPQAHAVGRGFGIGQLTQLIQPLMQLPQTGLNELLSFKSCLVLGVFAQITELHGLSDGLRQQDIEFVAELVDFAAKLLSHFTDHWCNQA